MIRVDNEDEDMRCLKLNSKFFSSGHDTFIDKFCRLQLHSRVSRVVLRLIFLVRKAAGRRQSRWQERELGSGSCDEVKRIPSKASKNDKVRYSG